MNKFLAKIVAWITAGYPEGVPGPDRVPLFALLKPRLTDDEVKAVAKELIERGEFDHVDIGVLITQITDELPAPRTSSACETAWPPRAGRWTTRATPRRPNSRPAPRRRPVRRVGAVAAAVAGGRAGAATGPCCRCPPTTRAKLRC